MIAKVTESTMWNQIKSKWFGDIVPLGQVSHVYFVKVITRGCTITVSCWSVVRRLCDVRKVYKNKMVSIFLFPTGSIWMLQAFRSVPHRFQTAANLLSFRSHFTSRSTMASDTVAQTPLSALPVREQRRWSHVSGPVSLYGCDLSY